MTDFTHFTPETNLGEPNRIKQLRALVVNCYAPQIRTYTANQCTGGTAIGSSVYAFGGCSYNAAFNGLTPSPVTSLSEIWGANAGVPQWIGYQFAAPKTITKLRLFNLNSTDAASFEGIKNFRVDGSNDGVVWTTVVDGLVGLDSETWVEYVFENSTAFSYWRTYATTTLTGTKSAGVIEIEMMETASTTNPLTIEVYCDKALKQTVTAASGELRQPKRVNLSTKCRGYNFYCKVYNVAGSAAQFYGIDYDAFLPLDRLGT